MCEDSRRWFYCSPGLVDFSPNSLSCLMGIGMVVYMCCVCLYIFCITTHLTSRKDIEPYIGVVVIEETPNGIKYYPYILSDTDKELCPCFAICVCLCRMCILWHHQSSMISCMLCSGMLLLCCFVFSCCQLYSVNKQSGWYFKLSIQ